MSDLPRLAVTVLAVRDLPRMRGFYLEALGWTPAVDMPVYVELAAPDGPRLALYDHLRFARNTGLPVGFGPAGPATTGHVELYLRCEDVERAARRLVAAGATLVSPSALRDWGDEVAYCADPEGNVIALARPPSVPNR